MWEKMNKVFKTRTRSSVYVAIISMLFFSISGAVLTIFGKEFPENYQWLFINPSYTNNPKAGWIIGVWSTVLAIHGTIAALSITFMSMFATEVSTSSKKRFESITRKFIFNKYKFLSFSMEAACGLLTGIFLIAIGGGAIQYSISISISLFFIVSYTKIYYRLYFLTENKNSVSNLLLNEFSLCGLNHQEDIKERTLKNEKLSQKTLTLKCITLSSPLPRVEDNEKEEYFIISSSDEELVNFDERKLQILDDFLEPLSKISPIKLYIDIEFNRKNNAIQALFKYREERHKPKLENAKKMARQAFLFSSIKEESTNYNECVDAVVGHIFDGLYSGDVTSLKFGLECVSNLSSSGEFESLLMKLDRVITTSGVEKSFQPHILANFYKKLFSLGLPSSNSKPQFKIFTSMLDLPFYIYDEQTYSIYFNEINGRLEDLSKYEKKSTIDGFLSRYINATFKHMEARNYNVFETNTNFLTKLEYLENSDDRNTLSQHQILLLNAATYNITLLLMRVNFINVKLGNVKYKQEREKIFYLLNKWLSARFFNELYFLDETYIEIFMTHSKRDLSHSISKIREISDGEVYGVSEKPTYMAILMLFYTSHSFGSFLSLAFIRDIKKFHKATGITTYSLEEMIKITESDEFIEACIQLESLKQNKTELDEIETIKKEVTQKNIKLKSELENIRSSILKIISDEVRETEISVEITEKYSQEITTHFIKNLSKIIDIEQCIESEINGPVTYTRPLSKRELIAPVDGCFYSRSPENHSMSTIYSLIRSALGKLEEIGYEVEHLDDIDNSISTKLVTIEYMIKDRSATYRFVKGINIVDDKETLKLPEPGIYYMNIQDSFNLQFNKQKPLSISFEPIKQTADKQINNYEFLSLISISPNIIIAPKGIIKLQFLSLKKCAELFEIKEEENRSLLAMRTEIAPDDKL